jgi:hypothetical protein
MVASMAGAISRSDPKSGLVTVSALFGGTIHKCAVSSSALRPPSLSVEDSMAESRLNREEEGGGEGAGRKGSG